VNATKSSPVYEDPAWVRPGPTDPFGTIISAFEIEQALAACVRRWMRNYLRAFARQRGWEEHKLRFYRTQVPSSFELNRLREDQLPALAIVSRGTTGTPERRNVGVYDARWTIDCYSACVAAGNRQARRLAQWYTAALRTLFVQHRTLQPTELDVLAVDWMGERYTARTFTEERTYAEGIATINVHVAGVTATRGPAAMYEPVPPEEPLPELSIAETHQIEVHPKEDHEP
jgi:hypothetical protein